MAKISTKKFTVYGFTAAQLQKLEAAADLNNQSMSEFILNTVLDKVRRIKVEGQENSVPRETKNHVRKSTDSGAKIAVFVAEHKMRLESLYRNYLLENPQAQESFELFAAFMHANGKEQVTQNEKAYV